MILWSQVHSQPKPFCETGLKKKHNQNPKKTLEYRKREMEKEATVKMSSGRTEGSLWSPLIISIKLCVAQTHKLYHSKGLFEAWGVSRAACDPSELHGRTPSWQEQVNKQSCTSIILFPGILKDDHLSLYFSDRNTKLISLWVCKTVQIMGERMDKLTSSRNN